MTINEKANRVNLPVEKVAALALAAGINTEDMDRNLSQPEAIKLGTAVKNYNEAEPVQDEPKTVRFWTKATIHLIMAGTEKIKFKGNVLVLNSEVDKNLIALIRRLANIAGSYCVYEVLDTPLGEDSDELAEFGKMLREIAFTGGNGEASRAGRKSLRAMFEPEELESMGAAGFDPNRLVMKVLLKKSLKPVSNNV